MGISNRVIKKAIREQMRTGRVPDLQKLQRKDREEQLAGKLSCVWERNKNGKFCYNVYLYSQFHHNQIPVHSFLNVSRNETGRIDNLINYYNRNHRMLLLNVSRNPSTLNIKNLQKELDTLVNAMER